MRRSLVGIFLIGIVSILSFSFSSAFFSDTETSTDNQLKAGMIDLLIDNTSYYNGVLNQGTTWLADNLPGHLFFNFDDIKPGDRGEDTISLHVNDNDAWACAQISLTKNDDNSCTEPENADDPSCSEPDNDLFDGELAQNLNMVFWADDGDNVLEDNEATGSGILLQGTAQDVLDSNVTLADSVENNLGGADGTPLQGTVTYYIGKAWCFGALTLAPLIQDNAGPDGPRTPANSTGGVTCSGTGLNNATQTDLVMADVAFNAVQSRNNSNFVCAPSSSPSPSPTPSPTPTSTPQACLQADVMLVLDRSGSINNTELAQLKTASNDFVDALAPSTTGIHAGMSSFATTGTLNQVLTNSGPTVKTAINGLAATGFTNLKQGIDLASGELVSVRDRADGSSPDKMIIVTDGHPNRPEPELTAPTLAAASATAAKAAGTEIFVVGVGGDVNAIYLQTQIASPGAGHYFSVSDYSGLQTTLQNLDFCNQ